MKASVALQAAVNDEGGERGLVSPVVAFPPEVVRWESGVRERAFKMVGGSSPM